MEKSMNMQVSVCSATLDSVIAVDDSGNGGDGCQIGTHLNEICVFRISNGDHSMHFFDKFLFFVIIEIHVPFGETSFASTILYQYEANLKRWPNKIEWMCNRI